MSAIRTATWGLALLTLAACGPLPIGPEDGKRGLLADPQKPAIRRQPPLARVALAGGDVVVAPPDGYCIDPKSHRSGAERGFAALGSCRILSGGAIGPYAEPVLMTVTVGPRGDADSLPEPQHLADAAGQPLIGGDRTGGLVLAHLGAGGARMLPGGDPRHWRGAFVLGGRVVGLALYAPRDGAEAGRHGAALLQALHARIVAESDKSRAVSKSTPRKRPRPAGGLRAMLSR